MGKLDTAREKARLRIRAAFQVLETEVHAVVRELVEAEIEAHETPTVRPPSQPAMEAVQVPKVEIVKIPGKGRYG